MRASHGNCKEMGLLVGKGGSMGTSHPFLAANVPEGARRRFSDRRSRLRTWEFVIFSDAACNPIKSKPDLERLDCLLRLLDPRYQDSGSRSV